jgi:heme/copper-type cytochrome/quinol oxidase subunit 4
LWLGILYLKKGYESKMKLSLFRRFVIVVSVVIAATDVIVFYHLQKNGIQSLTPKFVISVIVITIIPIVINLWYWLIFRQRKK